MEAIGVNTVPFISEIAMDMHFDFKLESWPAATALSVFCLSGVLIYGMKVYGKELLAVRTERVP